LLVDALDQEVVERAVVELVRVLDHGKGRAVAGMTGVGVRADIAGVRRRRDRAQRALQPAAADVAHLAVPRALHAAAPAINAIERKADTDTDALLLSHGIAVRRTFSIGVDEVRFAARRVAATGGDELREGHRGWVRHLRRRRRHVLGDMRLRREISTKRSACHLGVAGCCESARAERDRQCAVQALHF